MNKDMTRLCYSKPTVEYIRLSSPLDVLVLFSLVDIEVDQLEDGEDLDVV